MYTIPSIGKGAEHSAPIQFIVNLLSRAANDVFLLNTLKILFRL